MDRSVRPRCYLEFTQGDSVLGKVMLELFSDVAPRTCENFRSLCTGERGNCLSQRNRDVRLYYRGSIVHRVISDFMIQMGDFTNGDGTGGESIWGEKFDDETFRMKHDRPMLLSMANSGPNTNGSQFFITLKKTPWLDGKHVVFGRVVQGSAVIRKIEHTPVSASDRPYTAVLISRCGQLKLIRKKEALSKHQEIVADAPSADVDASQSSNAVTIADETSENPSIPNLESEKNHDKDDDDQASSMELRKDKEDERGEEDPSLLPSSVNIKDGDKDDEEGREEEERATTMAMEEEEDVSDLVIPTREELREFAKRERQERREKRYHRRREEGARVSRYEERRDRESEMIGIHGRRMKGRGQFKYFSKQGRMHQRRLNNNNKNQRSRDNYYDESSQHYPQSYHERRYERGYHPKREREYNDHPHWTTPDSHHRRRSYRDNRRRSYSRSRSKSPSYRGKYHSESHPYY